MPEEVPRVERGLALGEPLEVGRVVRRPHLVAGVPAHHEVQQAPAGAPRRERLAILTAGERHLTSVLTGYTAHYNGHHSQLKHRLRPMYGRRTDRTAQTIIAGHAFMQNHRGHDELGVDAPRGLRVAATFTELATAI